MGNEKSPSCLGHIGDYTTHVGIAINNDKDLFVAHIEILGMLHAAHILKNDGLAKNGLGQQILVVTGIFEKHVIKEKLLKHLSTEPKRPFFLLI